MTHKKIDKRKLAAKLAELTDNIANRGVYIAVPQPQGYAVLDYVTQHVILDQIPGKDIADKMADRFNSYKKVPGYKINKARELITCLYKHGNDIEFYRNIISKTDDEVKRDTARVRLNYSQQHLEKLTRDVSKI